MRLKNTHNTIRGGARLVNARERRENIRKKLNEIEYHANENENKK